MNQKFNLFIFLTIILTYNCYCQDDNPESITIIPSETSRLLEILMRLDTNVIELKEKNEQLIKRIESVEKYSKKSNLPENCDETYSGVIRVEVSPVPEPFDVFCDHNRWIAISYRFNGSDDFNRSWEEYKEGFGDLNRNFFIGLEKIYAFTRNQRCELAVRVGDHNNERRYIQYNDFRIGSEAQGFKLISLGKGTGDAGDSLRYHLGNKFSTYDRDNDNSTKHCAKIHRGGWWYNDCVESNLWGAYRLQNDKTPIDTGMYWKSFHDEPDSAIQFIAMHIRPWQSA